MITSVGQLEEDYMTKPYRTECEERVLLAARKYARMKLHRAYVDDGGNVCVCCHSDAENYAENLGEELLARSRDLLLSMSIDEIDGKLEA